MEDAYRLFLEERDLEDPINRVIIEPNGSETADASAENRNIIAYPEVPDNAVSVISYFEEQSDPKYNKNKDFWRGRAVHELAHIKNQENLDFSGYGEAVESTLEEATIGNPNKVLDRLAKERGFDNFEFFKMECWLGDENTDALIELLRDYHEANLSMVERITDEDIRGDYEKFAGLRGIDEVQAFLAEHKHLEGSDFETRERVIPGDSNTAYMIKLKDVVNVDTEAISEYFVQNRYDDFLQKDEEQLLNEFHTLN